MIDDQALDHVAKQAESILRTSIDTIDRKFGRTGYAVKNPGVTSNFLSLQNTLLQAAIDRKAS